MVINLIGPKNKDSWLDIWKSCYKIFSSLPYTLKLWDDNAINDFLKEDNIEFYKKLDTCPDIYKYDYVRYVILEKYGGAYFDLDVEMIQDFLPLLKNNKLYLYGGFAFSGIEPAIMVETNGFNKDFWFYLKKYIQHKVNDETKVKNTWYNVGKKTGPEALNSFYLMWINNHKENNIQLLPWELFGNTRHDLSYTVHHYSNSWHSSL